MRFDPRYRALGRLFGVTPERAWVTLNRVELAARYGPWRVRTPLSNIAGARLTGPYLLVKTAGPARLGIADRGLSFTSNGERGVELRFHRKIAGIDGLGLVKHPNLTLTVEEPERLLELLRERAGISG
ncbi:MAG: hypothetical protein ACYCU0_04225 [Solirubrobacteraceae bacterium]